MSQKLLEIFKQNAIEINLIKEDIKDMKNTINKLESEANTYSSEIKQIGEKSYYIERYLENLQNEEIQQIIQDENLSDNENSIKNHSIIETDE